MCFKLNLDGFNYFCVLKTQRPLIGYRPYCSGGGAWAVIFSLKWISIMRSPRLRLLNLRPNRPLHSEGSSGSGGNDDLHVATLGPIGEVLDKDLRPIAAPAVSPGTERGRQERKDRSDHSSFSKPSSSKVLIQAITKSPMSVRSSDRKSKPPRSNHRSARDSAPGGYGRNPELALEHLIAESRGGLTTNPLPTNDGMPRRIESDDAELSDVDDTVDQRTIRGKRYSSQHRGKDQENMVDVGETEEQQDVVKRAKAGCPECTEHENKRSWTTPSFGSCKICRLCACRQSGEIPC